MAYLASVVTQAPPYVMISGVFIPLCLSLYAVLSDETRTETQLDTQIAAARDASRQARQRFR